MFYLVLTVQEVNGKEVQISLTGFMEKNTGKFMKELWALLLSAQKNASGVPQQFLDAKQEETRKRKVGKFVLVMLFLFLIYVLLLTSCAMVPHRRRQIG